MRDKWFYSLCADDFEFLLMPLLLNCGMTEVMEPDSLSSRMSRVPVALFVSNEEKRGFLEYLRQVPVEEKKAQELLPVTMEQEVSQIDKEIIGYSRAVLERLSEYRKIAP